jgi:hypothetical protein
VDAVAGTITHHTILFVLGGVVVDFGASSFGFHNGLLFLSGAGKTFGVFSLVICLALFSSSFFLISLFYFTSLSTN